jgi:hypothetical protein
MDLKPGCLPALDAAYASNKEGGSKLSGIPERRAS